MCETLKANILQSAMLQQITPNQNYVKCSTQNQFIDSTVWLAKVPVGILPWRLVWKTRMVWLPGCEKKLEYVFVSTECTNITDRQTDKAWRHWPRLCIASHDKNQNKNGNEQDAQLSQRDCMILHVTEYFAKSLKDIQNDTWVGHV